jgi:hypothetical protein
MTPTRYEISDGSAYYVDNDALVQVPLRLDGSPDWDGECEVDWQRGIENDADRERLTTIQARLTQ